MSTRRSAGGVLLLVFLLVHLALLPRTLEDLDSVNFAMGVRQFDVAHHQPHPPGYPVFIALAKVSTAALRAVGVGAPAPRGLAIWSAMAGTAALPAVFIVCGALEQRRRVAWWATFVTAAAPVYWFTALRPLSDMAGFAVSFWAIALLLTSSTARMIALGALLAGIGAGIRSQTVVLTFPVLAYVLLRRTTPGRYRVLAVASAAAGALSWGIPLIVISGGPRRYLAALGAQAGEDFSGVAMLATQHSVRQIAAALVNTFIWPWDWWLGIGIVILAAAGAIRVGWRSRRAIAIIALIFVPYAVFHLLFQESITTRYALPLVPAAAYLALAALETRSKMAMPAAAAAIALESLLVAFPASAIYASDGAPVFRAFDDMTITAHGGERVDRIAMHAESLRASQWVEPILPAPLVRARHGREWLAVVDIWRVTPSAHVWFLANPRRTDLALFDPHARTLARAYRWGFVEPPFVGGARPNDVDWYHMRPPGWMLGKGWALTAEVGGITARDHAGPPGAPADAWVRARPEETMLVLGGRFIASSGAVPGNLRVDVRGAPAFSTVVNPGFFVREVPLPAGTFSGDGYVPLAVSAASPSNAPVSLEQFDIEGPGVPMVAYEDGWYEPEYNPSAGMAWRWMSDRAVLWLRPVGKPVTLHLSGESTARYYDVPARVRVLAGDREIAAFDTSVDFDQDITVPADALAAARGRLQLVSSRFFVPGRNGDQRHLAIRFYSVTVD